MQTEEQTLAECGHTQRDLFEYAVTVTGTEISDPEEEEALFAAYVFALGTPYREDGYTFEKYFLEHDLPREKKEKFREIFLMGCDGDPDFDDDKLYNDLMAENAPNLALKEFLAESGLDSVSGESVGVYRELYQVFTAPDTLDGSTVPELEKRSDEENAMILWQLFWAGMNYAHKNDGVTHANP